MIAFLAIIVIVVTIVLLRNRDRTPNVTAGDVLRRTVVRPLYWKQGAGGEAYVRGILDRLGPEYIVMNDVTFKTASGTTQIDHLVFSPYGIFVIETKDYGGTVYGSEYAEQWTQYIGNETHKFYNPVKQNQGHVHALRKKLGNLPFIPIVTFVGDGRLKITQQHPIVVGRYELMKAIMQHKEVKLTQEQTQNAANMIKAYSSILTPEEKAGHAASVWRKNYHRLSSISEGRCPQCGGSLIRRQGSYGAFLGCSNYPKCKFTTKI